MKHHVFLLSPANTSGRRCQILLAERAQFDLARRVRDGGAPIGEVMSFMSQLYFRGKVSYARAFSAPPPGCHGALVITAGPRAGTAGPTDHHQRPPSIRRGAGRPRQRTNSETAASRRAEAPRPRGRFERASCCSAASPRPSTSTYYSRVFGDALLFPSEFVGRGDMSRGGMMLRAADAGTELATGRFRAPSVVAKGRRSSLASSAGRPPLQTQTVINRAIDRPGQPHPARISTASGNQHRRLRFKTK